MANEQIELKPADISLGNFVENMGSVEMVMGIVPMDGGNWFICHGGWTANTNPIPDGITYPFYGLPLTDEWKECLGIDQYNQIPAHIKFVHEAQNWFKWHLRIDLRENMNWDKLPKI